MMPKISIFIAMILLMMACTKPDEINFQWTEQKSGTSLDLQSLWFSDSLHGHVVGGDTWYKGIYLNSDDAGQTWEMDTLGDKLLFALQFNAEGQAHAVGIDGHIFEKRDAQSPWAWRRFYLASRLTGVSFWDPAHGLACGGAAFQSGIIYRLDANYQILHQDTFPQEISAICWSDSNTAHAVGYGLVLRSRDAGLSWQYADIDGDFFRSVYFPSPKVGYAVGASGTIIKTSDAGQTWTKLNRGGNIGTSNPPFRAVYFVDEQIGFIAGESGNVWHTKNGGETWSKVNNAPDADFQDIFVAGSKGWVVAKGGVIWQFDWK